MNLHFGYLSNQVESLLDTFVANVCTFLQFRVVCVPIEAQYEIRLVRRDSDEISGTRPVDLYVSSVTVRTAQLSLHLRSWHRLQFGAQLRPTPNPRRRRTRFPALPTAFLHEAHRYSMSRRPSFPPHPSPGSSCTRGPSYGPRVQHTCSSRPPTRTSYRSRTPCCAMRAQCRRYTRRRQRQ